MPGRVITQDNQRRGRWLNAEEQKLMNLLLWVYELFHFMNVLKKQDPPLRLNMTDSRVVESLGL